MAAFYPDVHDSFSPGFARLSRRSNTVPMYPYQSQPQCLLLSLPAELRVQIYSYLVLPPHDGTKPSMTGLALNDHHNYYTGLSNASDSEDGTRSTLELRTLDPTREQMASSRPVLRTQMSIKTSRFRAATMLTTYALAHNPGIYTSIMLASRQCHAEAAALLYSSFTFSFSTHVEAIEPFLQDLTPYSRACIKSVGLVKRGLPYEREFDRAEWEAACAYMANPSSGLTGLRELRVGVVAGCPGADGWEGVRTFSRDDFIERLGRTGKGGVSTPPQIEFRDFRGVRYAVGVTTVEEDEWRGMEWVGQLMSIKGLAKLDVRAIVEHCPPPMSERMEFWVAFSKSVEGGFADFLKDGMIGM